MLKQRRLLGQQLADQLFAAEAAIDAALAATATLAAMMPTARQEAGVAACMGQDAILSVIQTCGDLGQARSNIVATHRALAAVQKQAGLGAVNFGGWVDKEADPADVRSPSGTRQLTPVARVDRAA